MAGDILSGLICQAMTWIALIEQELPRLRLYASALLRDLSAGDTAVEEALSELVRYHLPSTPARGLLFGMVDAQVRELTAHPAEDRIELLKHVCGFGPEDCAAIIEWTSKSVLKSAC